LSRILFVSKPVAPPWNDSSKNLVRDLALGLTRHDAVAFGPSGGQARLGRTEILPIHPAERGGFSPGLRENARVLRELVLGARADAWHFFFAPNPRTSTLARLTARARRMRSVQTVCSVPAPQADLERVLFGDRVVVLSRHTEARFLHAGIARERIARIPPCAPPLEPAPDAQRRATRREFGLDPERPLLLYPGDLEFGNAAALMLEAHAGLAPDVELLLACRPKTPAARALERTLRERTTALGTHLRVRFLGETNRILALLAAADVVALPSSVAYAKMDYPLVLLEAMALGRPVVVAEQTPAAELAQAGGAIAVAPRLDDLASVLGGLLADSERRERLGAAGRALVLSGYTRPHMAAAYELLYDELLS
jgi:glycosyltransferase involved in cell wall biosynthesis